MSSMTATAKLAAICAAAAAALFLVERGIRDRRASAGDVESCFRITPNITEEMINNNIQTSAVHL